MKKFFTLFTLLAVITAATPKKSEAGIVLIAGSSPLAGASLLSAGVIPSIYGVKLIVAEVNEGSPWHLYGIIGGLATAVGLTLIVLDADGSIPQDQLASIFKQNYSEIDNDQAFDALAALVKSKATALPFMDGKKEISISTAELHGIFKSVDLKGKEAVFLKMVNDLK